MRATETADQEASPMGFLRDRHDDGATGSRFQMRQRLLSIGDDYWIETEDGQRAFHVDGKALRIRQTFVLEDTAGNEVAKLQERKLSVRDKMEIERDGRSLATVKKRLIGIRDRFMIDVEGGHELVAKGNLVDHEYEIERDGDTVATVSKRWFRVRDTYGVEIAPGEDDALVLAITVCIDALSHPRD
jgi:uncharacterized protein YxjI